MTGSSATPPVRPRAYVICTTPRSGSYLLCEALEATRRLGVPREYFDASPGKLKWWAGRLNIASDHDYVEKVLAAGATPNGVFGLKLHWYQIEEMAGRLARADSQAAGHGAMEAFARLQDRFDPVQVVWLRRRNKVAQAISLHRAYASGSWHERPSAPDKRPEVAEARFDFAAIERHRATLEAHDQHWFEFFKATKRKVLAVDYEEFTRGPEPFQQTIVETARFLGVALNRIEVEPPAFRKQADAISAEWEARFRKGPANGKASASPAKTSVAPAQAAGRPRLIAYDLNPSLGVRISTASPRRRWMDETPHRFAYRCLPMTIANQHGWFLHTPCAVRARWNGGPGLDGLQIEYAAGRGRPLASSHFGAGILTFSMNYLFRTPPGVNLWVRGPANSPKDGIYPLDGIVETDWSEATFTMNWRFTRADQWVTFEADEPFAMILPMGRGELEEFEPEILPIASNPTLEAGYAAWSKSRAQFNSNLKAPTAPARDQGWQRHYMRGEAPSRVKAQEHQTGLALRDFKERRE